MRPLRCDRHGVLPWNGEVICARDAGGCGRVWKLERDEDIPPTECGKNCICGKPLTGPAGTARAICAKCYADRKTKPS